MDYEDEAGPFAGSDPFLRTVEFPPDRCSPYPAYKLRLETAIAELPAAERVVIKSLDRVDPRVRPGVRASRAAEVVFRRSCPATTFLAFDLPPSARRVVLVGVARFDPTALGSVVDLVWRWERLHVCPEILRPRIPWLESLHLDGVFSRDQDVGKALLGADSLRTLSVTLRRVRVGKRRDRCVVEDVLSVAGSLPSLRDLRIRADFAGFHYVHESHWSNGAASLFSTSLARSASLEHVRIEHAGDELLRVAAMDFQLPPNLRELRLCNVVPDAIRPDSPLARRVVSVHLTCRACGRFEDDDEPKSVRIFAPTFFETLAYRPERLPLRSLSIDSLGYVEEDELPLASEAARHVVPVQMDVELDTYLQARLLRPRALFALAAAEGGAAQRLLDRDGGAEPHALGPLVREIARFVG